MGNEWFTNSMIVRYHLDALEAEIKPGDWYLATRNGPPQVLRCGAVDEENGWICTTPETFGYSFNTGECWRFKSSVPEDTMLAIYKKSREEFLTWLANNSSPKGSHREQDRHCG